jgi:hypothetical protein
MKYKKEFIEGKTIMSSTTDPKTLRNYFYGFEFLFIQTNNNKNMFDDFYESGASFGNDQPAVDMIQNAMSERLNKRVILKESNTGPDGEFVPIENPNIGYFDFKFIIIRQLVLSDVIEKIGPVAKSGQTTAAVTEPKSTLQNPSVTADASASTAVKIEETTGSAPIAVVNAGGGSRRRKKRSSKKLRGKKSRKYRRK